jgi:hypothetical protein
LYKTKEKCCLRNNGTLQEWNREPGDINGIDLTDAHLFWSPSCSDSVLTEIIETRRKMVHFSQAFSCLVDLLFSMAVISNGSTLISRMCYRKSFLMLRVVKFA